MKCQGRVRWLVLTIDCNLSELVQAINWLSCFEFIRLFVREAMNYSHTLEYPPQNITCDFLIHSYRYPYYIKGYEGKTERKGTLLNKVSLILDNLTVIDIFIELEQKSKYVIVQFLVHYSNRT